MSREKVLFELKTKLAATVGTYGSIIGCTLDRALQDFRKDWFDDLYHYVRILGHKNLNELLSEMSDTVRLEDKTGYTQIYAVSSQKLSHCFDLIDRTKPKQRYRDPTNYDYYGYPIYYS